jgi:hypothetical protein
MSADQSYAARVRKLAERIVEKAKAINEMEDARLKWTSEKGISIWVGQQLSVVRADGVNPALAGVQREALAYIDNRIHLLSSELEGLRFQLIQLGRPA